MDEQELWSLVVVLLIVALIAVLYPLLRLPKLWGPERGVPFCLHPFERANAQAPVPSRWQCPQCRTWFARGDGGWWVVDQDQ